MCETMDSRKSALPTILRNRRSNAQDVWELGDAVSVREEDIFCGISVFMALYPPARKYSDGSRIWRGMLDNVPCVNVGNTDGSCSRQLQSYD